MAEEEKKDPIIFDEQGILLSNIIDLTKGRSKKGIRNTNSASMPDQAAAAYKNFLSPSSERGLPNVCLIDTETPSTFLNLLKGDPTKNDILLRLSTFELSSLVPVIRIFKVFYDLEIDQELILEFPFDTTANDIDSIFQTSTGRGSGVGITSIDWKQNPKNEANLSTYKVNLNLHLQNIEEFFKKRYSTTINNKIFSIAIEDLLYQRKEFRKKTNEGSAVYDPDKYVIKMIVGWQISEAGLESIKDNSDRSKEETDLLLDALREQKDVLYLTFISHQIEFNEDGSVDLQINYFGRADTNIADIEKSNVFSLGSSYEAQVQNLKSQIQALERETSSIKEQVDKQDSKETELFDPSTWNKAFRTDTDNENKLENQNKTLEVLREDLKNLQLSAKKTKFNRLITRMLQRKYIHLFSYNNEIVELTSKLKGKFNLQSVTNVKDIEEYNKEKNALDARIKQEEKSQATGGKDNILQIRSADQYTISVQTRDALKELDPGVANGELPFVYQPSSGTGFLDKIYDWLVEDDVTTAHNDLYNIITQGDFEKSDGNGRTNFSFFYLSSLIDVLIEPIMNNNYNCPNFINKKTRVILGPMTLVDYGSLVSDGRTYKIFDSVEAEKADQPTYVKVFKGETVSINVGDIPISLKDFALWFNEYYVNKDKEQVAFNEFVSSLINDLVITSINNQVYPYAPKQKAKFSIDCFTSVIGPKNESIFINNIKQYRFGSTTTINPSAGGFRIDQRALESLKTKGRDMERDHDPNSDDYLPNKDYIVIYCINEAPYERIGDYFEDKKDGILHLYAGDSKGTIRSLKFSRVDNPNRRAENILAATGEGAGVSKVIREKYNVNIEMFGNTAIQAGTYVFLRPTFSGASNKDGNSVQNTEKILRELGLGGYYMVTEVQSNIDIGDFRTTIRGTWSAFGDGTMNDGEREYADLPPNTQATKGQVL